MWLTKACFDIKWIRDFSHISSPINTARIKDVDVNSTSSLCIASPLVNFDGLSNLNANLPDNPRMPNLEDTGISDGAYDDEEFVARGDMNNLESFMLDELLQFKLQKVWTLVDLPYGKRAIGTKWVYRNKKDKRGIVVRKITGKKEDGIFISQDKYVDEILKKFGFSTVRIASIPMKTSKPLLKDIEAEDVYVHLYRLMIRSLMYLTASRPDIMFVVCACARYQVTPKVLHFHVVKRIFKYLKCQPKLGLWYPKDLPFDLKAYTESDYDGASLDRKSTTRGCQFLRSRLISWQCKKQTVVANSTTKAEYVAASNCCGQATAKAKMVNGERQLQALVDRKKVIITETSIRRDLYLEDAEAEQEEGEGSAMPTDPQHTPTTTHPSTSQPQKQKSKKSKKKNTEVPQLSGSPDDVADENVTQTFNDLLLSGEDRLQLTYVMDLCTKLSKRFIDLEHTKTTQAREITRLKLRVKKLEKKAGSRTHKLKRLYKFGATRRVESPKDEGLGDQEDASKQGRSIEDIDKDAEVTLVDETQERYDDLMFDTAVFDNEEVVTTTAKEVSTADQVTTAGSYYYWYQNSTLAALKSAKPKEKDVVQEPNVHVSTASTGVSTTATKKSKDKGKAIMIKPEVPLKKKEQVRLDEELARKLEAEELEAARLEREEDKKLEQANIALIESWDNVEDLETLWKLVKTKHGNTRPEEEYERVLWSDLKVMFERDIESEVWRNLKGYKVTVWKLFDSYGVHFVRFQNLHIFMLVEKRYPLTPATIQDMLNKKLQIDQWNEMSYQLLKLIIKQLKNPGSAFVSTVVLDVINFLDDQRRSLLQLQKKHNVEQHADEIRTRYHISPVSAAYSYKMALQIGGFNLPGAGVREPIEVPTKVLC
ncbi:hypothetical protein Tco_1506634 [Tanacetum coccineum]